MAKHVSHDRNGNKISEDWYDEIGHRHRDGDLPAIIRYNGEGGVVEEFWFKHGEKCRDNDLPSVLHYDDNGKVVCEQWWSKNKFHRENGPAVIDHDRKIKIYCLYGIKLDDHEYYVSLANDIRKDRKLAILHVRHKLEYIREVCEEVLNKKI